MTWCALFSGFHENPPNPTLAFSSLTPQFFSRSPYLASWDPPPTFLVQVKEKTSKLKELEADLLRRAEIMRDQLHTQEAELTVARQAFEAERVAWLEAWKEFDEIGPSGDCFPGSNASSATLSAPLVNSGRAPGLVGAPSIQLMGLGDRVLSEVIKERTKTEKKRKGLF
ncbi:unnamed protein product [Protopolystoma xenopodis]|uniref:Uncharacterized protein n=1 Tax=Protopolystoma xenopodis TaxID=117903 RepID=A0A3S5B436_9PLAT|nr:unnamed protein product [Protopolystoma xenopodis]